MTAIQQRRKRLRREIYSVLVMSVALGNASLSEPQALLDHLMALLLLGQGLWFAAQLMALDADLAAWLRCHAATLAGKALAVLLTTPLLLVSALLDYLGNCYLPPSHARTVVSLLPGALGVFLLIGLFRHFKDMQTTTDPAP